MRRVALHIQGKVQGVFYRRDAAREALRLGLKGFVRNEPNGSVYAEAEGTPEKVGEFIRWCRKGPSNARVEDVKVEEMTTHFDTPAGSGLLSERLSEEEFEVRY